MKTLLTIAAIILVMAVVLALLGRFQRGRSRVIAVEQRPAHEGPPSVARERRSAVGSGRASATVEASPEPGPEPGSEPGPEPGPEPGSGSGAARRARGIPKAPRDIRIGDLLLVTGSRSEIEDMPLRVREIHGYQGDNAFWYEFVCEGDRGRVTLEVESLESLALGLESRPRKLRELGVRAAELERMAETERGRVRFEGRDYELVDSGRARWFEGPADATGKPVYYWNFESEDGKQGLGVEFWPEGQSWEVWRLQPLPGARLEIQRGPARGARTG